MTDNQSFKLLAVLVVSGILLFTGSGTLRSYYRGHEKEIANLERLSTEGFDRVAQCWPDGTSEVSLPGYEKITYTYGYTFSVNGQYYYGKVTFDVPPDTPAVVIRYLPDNPKINAANVAQKLATLRAAQASDTQFWIGAVLLSLGAAGLLGFIFYLIQQRRKR